MGAQPDLRRHRDCCVRVERSCAGKREPAMRKRHPPTRRHANRRVTHWLSGVRVLVSAQRFGEIALEDL
jgi:hypothetical protein